MDDSLAATKLFVEDPRPSWFTRNTGRDSHAISWVAVKELDLSYHNMDM